MTTIINFNLNNVSFSDPVPDNSTGIRNTKIRVNAVPSQGYLDGVDVFYNRIEMTALGSGVWLFSDIEFTPDIIVGILNTARAAPILTTDLVIPVIPPMIFGDIVPVNLTADPLSLDWTGQNNMTMIIGFPAIASALNTLVNTTLPAPGFVA